jgi:hypothetical protein
MQLGGGGFPARGANGLGLSTQEATNSFVHGANNLTTLNDLTLQLTPSKGKARDISVQAELARSPYDHVRIDAVGFLGVTEAEVRNLFGEFDVDKVCLFLVEF